MLSHALTAEIQFHLIQTGQANVQMIQFKSQQWLKFWKSSDFGLR